MQETFKPRIEKINGVDHLIVAIPMQPPALSSSEKTYIVAKCPSPVKSGVLSDAPGHDGKEITYSGNAWVKK